MKKKVAKRLSQSDSDQRAQARKRLGQRLKQARRLQDLTQEFVSDHLGIPRPAMSLIENGLRGIDFLELHQLSQLHGCSMSYFTADEAGH